MSKLEEILQAEVEAEINGILAEADSQAAKMVSEAASRAAAKVAAHRKMIDAAARAATQQAQSAAELSVAQARLQAKGEVMDLLRQKVQLALEETASQPGYGEVLQTLAEEALGVAADAVAVVLHPHDQEKLSDWARHTGARPPDGPRTPSGGADREPGRRSHRKHPAGAAASRLEHAGTRRDQTALGVRPEV